MNKLTKKCVSAIASLAMAGTLCVAGAVTMASVAWGVPKPPLKQATGDPADAPWCKKKDGGACDNLKTEGTLTIKKYKYKESTDGNHQGDGLDGAKFTLTKVTKIDNVDLNYSEFSAWSTIAGVVDKLNRGDATGAKLSFGSGDGNVYNAETKNGGTATIANLPVGLYKVVETPPAGYGAADMTEFYITMPLIGSMTSAGATKATTFNWSPEISPKNKDLSKSFSKKLDDGKGHNSVLAKDGTLDYTIKAKVNRTKSGDLTKDDISGFAVFDDFPTAAFGTNVESSAVKSVSFGDGDDAELTSNTDYEVSIVKASSEADGKNLESGRNRILVKFKDPGLTKIATKLNGAKNGDPDVKVNIELTLSDEYKNGNAPAKDQKSTENTTVVNKSGFFPASPKGTPDANKPDPIVSGDDEGTSTVKYGWFDVFKYDAADEGKDTKTGLKGAEFRLFNTKEKAETCAQALTVEKTSVDSITNCNAASSTFKGDEATTQETTGKLNAPVKVQAGTNIYLVEVKAPEGYIRLPKVKAVNVKEGETTTVEFSNTKKSSESNWAWFNLPATGATGVIIFALAGMGLIAASVFLYMRNRKEEEQQAKA